MPVRLVRSAAFTVAVAGILIWAPAASAQPSEPAPSASVVPAETLASEAGSVEITAKDTAGGVLPGAVSLLLDSAGQEAGRGQSDAQGKLTFPDLAPGVYRLKETTTGSTLHEVIADQDVIVTPGKHHPADDHRPVQGRQGPPAGQGQQDGKAPARRDREHRHRHLHAVVTLEADSAIASSGGHGASPASAAALHQSRAHRRFRI